MGVQVPQPVDVWVADDRIELDRQRRRRRKPAGPRFEKRQAAVAVSDGRDAAWGPAAHLHDRRTAAAAGPRGHDPYPVGAPRAVTPPNGCRGRALYRP